MTIGKTGYVQFNEIIEAHHVNEAKMVRVSAAATARSGDVFVLGTGADQQAEVTTIRANPRPVVVAAQAEAEGDVTIPAGSPGWFQGWGQCAKVNLTSAATRGCWLITSSQERKAEPIASVEPPPGAFAFALTEGCAPVAFLLGGAPVLAHQEYRPPKLLRSEWTPLAPDETKLLDYSGEGAMEYVWLTFEASEPPGDPDAAWKHRLKIYVDEHIDADTIVGNFFASAFGSPRWTTNRMGCTRMDMEAGKSSFYRFVKIPFSQSFGLSVKNVASATTMLWAQVGIREGAFPPRRRERRFRAHTQLAATVGQYASHVLAAVTPGKPGRVEGFMLAVDGNTNWSSLEGNVEVWTDGVKRAEYTGTEDAFFGSFYYADVKWQAGFAGMTKQHTRTENTPVYQCCFYRFFDDDPLPFENDFKIVWYNGEEGRGEPGAVPVYSEIWYYES